jgi:hypothetical protein
MAKLVNLVVILVFEERWDPVVNELQVPVEVLSLAVELTDLLPSRPGP